jgi:hypothetical protein
MAAELGLSLNVVLMSGPTVVCFDSMLPLARRVQRELGR